MKIFKKEWKQIEEFPNYDVANTGEVRRSLTTKRGWGTFPGKVLKQTIIMGYCYVDLVRDRKHGERFAIHQLVLHHFGGDCPDGCEPNHKDGCRNNNNILNLEWLNIFENRSRKGEDNGSSKLKEGEVWLIKKLLLCYKFRSKIINLSQIAKMFVVDIKTIQRIKNNTHWKHISV